MAALLVGLAVMAVMMSVALPVWRHEAQRQKEDELIWRGLQYVRAIRLYQMKNGGLPASVDVLVDGHFLRKKYKDPITNDDFDLLGAGSTAGTPGLGVGQAGQATPGRGGTTTPTTTSTQSISTMSGMGTPQMSTTFQPSSSGPAVSGGSVPGGLSGVRSKSKDESIKIYQGRTHYNEWTFIFVGSTPGIGGAGGRGGPVGPNGQPLGGPNGTGRGGNGRGDGRGGDGRGRGLNGPVNGPGRGFGPGVPFNPGNLPPGFPPVPGRAGGGRGGV
jgi:type II secretory pathway pseudopilin PulG